MSDKVFLAVDLGASSGRVVGAVVAGDRIRIEEVHRFENGAVAAAGSLYWDTLALWRSICTGLRAARARYGDRIRSLGVDTWGVDFGLLGRGDVLLENPHSYRDPRTEGMLDYVLGVVPRAEVFRHTGLQFLPINTLFQLMVALERQKSPLLDVAEHFLMIPDLMHWLLTGEKANEMTIASTSQFYDPTRRAWATELLERLGLPTRMMGRLIEPGTPLGPLRSEVARETGLGPVQVVVPGTHDTASAVMAVPARGGAQTRPNWCYLSSGTWSLMGVEVPEPVIDDKVLALNFTNEGGVGNTIRLLKNITGLWLVQECRRVWALAGREYSWEELNRMAAAAPALAALIDPDDASFQAPGDMPEAIRGYCLRTGQSVPADEGGVVRCALESLALKYRHVLEMLEQLTQGRIETIHIVGGGTQNVQLCQATADACDRRVLAGPVEATAIGNVMLQAMADGVVGSIEQARAMVAQSFHVQEYMPHDRSAWQDAYGRFLALIQH